MASRAPSHTYELGALAALLLAGAFVLLRAPPAPCHMLRL